MGHNIFSFDLPFLFMRSRLLRVEVPTGIVRIGGRYPDWNPKFCDTLVAAAFGDRAKFTNLNKLARFFGVGAKTEGVSGKDFAKLWADDHAKAVEYLSNDINLTVAVAKAMGLI